jgi:hypothetical protein
MGKNGYWVPADFEDKEITYTYEQHKPVPLKGTPWHYCQYCGLVFLKNRITRWCVRMGCSATYHPQFKNILKKYAK